MGFFAAFFSAGFALTFGLAAAGLAFADLLWLLLFTAAGLAADLPFFFEPVFFESAVFLAPPFGLADLAAVFLASLCAFLACFNASLASRMLCLAVCTRSLASLICSLSLASCSLANFSLGAATAADESVEREARRFISTLLMSITETNYTETTTG